MEYPQLEGTHRDQSPAPGPVQIPQQSHPGYSWSSGSLRAMPVPWGAWVVPSKEEPFLISSLSLTQLQPFLQSCPCSQGRDQSCPLGGTAVPKESSAQPPVLPLCVTSWQEGLKWRRTSLFLQLCPHGSETAQWCWGISSPDLIALLCVVSTISRLLATKCHKSEQIFCPAASSLPSICLICIFRTRISQGLNEVSVTPSTLHCCTLHPLLWAPALRKKRIPCFSRNAWILFPPESASNMPVYIIS